MKKLFLSALVLFGSLAGNVANADPVDHREHRQETRIDHGQQDGSLTHRESRRLSRQQRRIEREEHRIEADGVVTPREAARLQRHQDNASRNIYRARHNQRHAH